MKTKKPNPKDALGMLKVPIGLYPNVARIETCRVFAQSAPEYGEFNWRNNPVRLSIYLDAIDRHLIALRAGQDIDPKSKLPHAAHINACTAIIMESSALGILIDDRYEKDVAADLLAAYTPAIYDASRRKVKPKPARTLDQVRAEVARYHAEVARRRSVVRGRRRPGARPVSRKVRTTGRRRSA
jgi:hypothetical protein